MVELSANAKSKSTAKAKIRTRMDLSYHHLSAACHFAHQIGEIEAKPSDQFKHEDTTMVLQLSLAVATSTVAALESYVNSLYFDKIYLARILNPTAVEKIAELVDKAKVIDKFDLFLAIKTGKCLVQGDRLVQNIDILVKLRNAVIHFKPEWNEEQDKHDKLSKQLRPRIKPSKFFNPEPLFPCAWASHSFAMWAIRSVIDFLSYFYSEVEIKFPITELKKSLQLESGLKL